MMTDDEYNSLSDEEKASCSPVKKFGFKFPFFTPCPTTKPHFTPCYAQLDEKIELPIPEIHRV